MLANKVAKNRLEENPKTHLPSISEFAQDFVSECVADNEYLVIERGTDMRNANEFIGGFEFALFLALTKQFSWHLSGFVDGFLLHEQ